MAAMPAYSDVVLRSWIDALKMPSKMLTDWEERFVASVSVQLELRGSLSPKQVETLERIYAEKTA